MHASNQASSRISRKVTPEGTQVVDSRTTADSLDNAFFYGKWKNHQGYIKVSPDSTDYVLPGYQKDALDIAKTIINTKDGRSYAIEAMTNRYFAMGQGTDIKTTVRLRKRKWQ